MMQVVKAITKRGDRVENEDAFGYTENALWVIDGATDLFQLGLSEGDDVAFYVSKLSEEISFCFNKINSLSEIIINAIINTNKKCKIDTSLYEAYKFPSFAIAIVRYEKERLEYLVLGDCTLIAMTNKEIIEITDMRLAKFSDMNKKGIEKLRDNNMFDQINELKLFQKTRSYMNREGGYWIGSVDPIGLRHALVGELTINSESKIICCTDGFLEAFKLFKLSEISEEIFDERVLERLEIELRKKQIEDSDRKIARVRVKDDLTYILAR